MVRYIFQHNNIYKALFFIKILDPAEISVAERLHEIGEQIFKRKAVSSEEHGIRSDNSLARILSQAIPNQQKPIAIMIDGKRYDIMHNEQEGVAVQCGDEVYYLGTNPQAFLTNFRQFVGNKKFSVLYRE